MRILILGGGGMLGHKLVQRWSARFDVWATLRGAFSTVERFGFFNSRQTLAGVSAENFDTVIHAFAVVRPAVVVNCIGVIKQLETVKDPIQTLSINSIFPHRVAKLCRAAGARLITLSTDCVFSGERGNYTEADTPDAHDLYGQSKHWGETTSDNCLSVRTSIIGRELGTAHSLVEWFLGNRGGGGGKRVKGFTNAIYTGFPTIVFADLLADIVVHQPHLSGMWHVSSDSISKYELLKIINREFDANLEIEPFDDFHCDRSLNSSRFRSAANFQPQSWDEMIGRMAQDSTPYDTWKNR